MVVALKSRVQGWAAVLGLGLLMILVVPAASGAAVLPLSSDPFTQATCAASTTTNHHTEVEPDTFANGSTIASAFQATRVSDWGASASRFSTSTHSASHG